MSAAMSTMPVAIPKPTFSATTRPLPTPLPSPQTSSSSSILSLNSFSSSSSSSSSAPTTPEASTVSETIIKIRASVSHSLKHKEPNETVTPERERLRALAAARALVAELETPFERVWQLTAALPALNAALKVARDVRLFELWEAEEEVRAETVEGKGVRSVGQLAKLTGVDKDLMHRLLRHMAATFVVEAVGPGLYRQTAFTRAMQGKGPGSWIDEHDELISPIFAHLPAFLASRGYVAPDSATDAVFQAVKPLVSPEATPSSTTTATTVSSADVSTPNKPAATTGSAAGYTVFDYWAQHPGEAATFTEAMGSFTNAKESWFDWFPVDELLDDVDGDVELGGDVPSDMERDGPVTVYDNRIPVDDDIVEPLNVNATTDPATQTQNLNHVFTKHRPDLPDTTAGSPPESSIKPRQNNPSSLSQSPALSESASTEPTILPPPSTQPGPLIVDIGGNIGRDLDALLRRFPHIPADRTVLLDRPEVVAQATCHAGVRRVGHDFFEPLPECLYGARIYYLHAVLHDWPTADARRILARIRPAMQRAGRGQSRLILNEWVLRDGAADAADASVSGSSDLATPPSIRPGSKTPDTTTTTNNEGAVSSTNRFVDGDAATTCDLIMMAALGARERTEAEWRELLASEGFRVSRVGFAVGCGDGVVEAVLV